MHMLILYIISNFTCEHIFNLLDLSWIVSILMQYAQ
jgi:hypothetical protein